MKETEKPRTETGEWEPTASEQEVIEAIQTHSPAATSEVADEIDMTRQGADARLRRLHEAGVVDKKKIGASLVWFIDTDADADADADGSSDAMPTVEDGLNPDAVTKDYVGDADE